jgi:hypothetical protein
MALSIDKARLAFTAEVQRENSNPQSNLQRLMPHDLSVIEQQFS